MFNFACQARNINVGGQEVKGQGHMRPKTDLEARRGHDYRSRWVEYLFKFIRPLLGTGTIEAGVTTKPWSELYRVRSLT